MAENYYSCLPPGITYRSSCPSVLLVDFISQPPGDLRKSNFFNFKISIKSGNHPVHVEGAQFVDFLNEREDGIRNGIKYSVKLRTPHGVQLKYLYLILVDAATHEPIRYEGCDDNPQMQRVLLTHEAICTRCRQQKSCGNKSEAPSDPRSAGLEPGTLQFFLKCNQNCLKGAGNPRDMRRFALAFSFSDVIRSKSDIVALSHKIFVHNNSKHSRKRKRDADTPDLIPALPVMDLSSPTYIYPKWGLVDHEFSFNSRQWCKPGVSFRCKNVGLSIVSMIEDVAMSVLIPVALQPGRHFVTLYFNETPVFTFPYEIRDMYHSEMDSRNGFLFLIGSDKSNCDFKCGPGNLVEYVSEGARVPNWYHICPTAHPYHQGWLEQHTSPVYSRSSSSLSPDLSGGSVSPSNYILPGQQGY